MPLLERNKRIALGLIQSIRTDVVELQELLSSDPRSSHFKADVGDTPRELYRYLLACQQMQYGRTIMEDFPLMNKQVLMRNLKLILQNHSADTIKRAIKYASLVCKRPYTPRMVRYFCWKFRSIDG